MGLIQKVLAVTQGLVMESLAWSSSLHDAEELPDRALEFLHSLQCANLLLPAGAWEGSGLEVAWQRRGMWGYWSTAD